MSGPHREWAAEREVDATQAAALVGTCFPALRGQPVQPLASGWDHTVHRVGQQWVFRFPRRAVALPGYVRELDLLPRLGPRLPLPVPVPVWRAEPPGGWLFSGARMLPGRELADAGLAGAARMQVAQELGDFLRVLHDPALVDSLGVELPVDPNVRADPRVRVPRVRAALAGLVAARVWPGPDGADVVDAVDAVLAEADGLGPPDGPPVLVHGDLHLRHVLVDDKGAVTGVIDWGDVCRGDACLDLSLAYAAFTGPARRAFLSAYGAEVSRERELRARVLALFLCAALATYALDEDRPVLLAESLRGLRRAAA